MTDTREKVYIKTEVEIKIELNNDNIDQNVDTFEAMRNFNEAGPKVKREVVTSDNEHSYVKEFVTCNEGFHTDLLSRSKCNDGAFADMPYPVTDLSLKGQIGRLKRSQYSGLQAPYSDLSRSQIISSAGSSQMSDKVMTTKHNGVHQASPMTNIIGQNTPRAVNKPKEGDTIVKNEINDASNDLISNRLELREPKKELSVKIEVEVPSYNELLSHKTEHTPESVNTVNKDEIVTIEIFGAGTELAKLNDTCSSKSIENQTISLTNNYDVNKQLSYYKTKQSLLESHIYSAKQDLISKHPLSSFEKCYSCKICPYKSRHRSALHNHMITHSGEKRYHCDSCDSKFGRRGDLVLHIRKHTGVRPFACIICASTFARKAHLTSHMRAHTGEKPYACKLCDSKFSEKSSLVTHIRIHTGATPYACSICNKQYKHLVSLNSHMRSHTGEKPYACELCGSRFVERSSLVTHMRAHSGEKPYGCDICDRKFVAKGTLATHMRTHTGVTPFACNICEKKYKHQMSLNYHMRTHTGESSCESIY